MKKLFSGRKGGRGIIELFIHMALLFWSWMAGLSIAVAFGVFVAEVVKASQWPSKESPALS
jgi:hypothetical protein